MNRHQHMLAEIRRWQAYHPFPLGIYSKVEEPYRNKSTHNTRREQAIIQLSGRYDKISLTLQEVKIAATLLRYKRMSNFEMGHKLEMSDRVLNSTIKSLYDKLACTSKRELIDKLQSIKEIVEYII